MYCEWRFYRIRCLAFSICNTTSCVLKITGNPLYPRTVSMDSRHDQTSDTTALFTKNSRRDFLFFINPLWLVFFQVKKVRTCHMSLFTCHTKVPTYFVRKVLLCQKFHRNFAFAFLYGTYPRIARCLWCRMTNEDWSSLDSSELHPGSCQSYQVLASILIYFVFVRWYARSGPYKNTTIYSNPLLIIHRLDCTKTTETFTTDCATSDGRQRRFWSEQQRPLH